MKKPYWGFLAVQLALPLGMLLGGLTGRSLELLHPWGYALVLGAASLPLTAAVRKSPGPPAGAAACWRPWSRGCACWETAEVPGPWPGRRCRRSAAG